MNIIRCLGRFTLLATALVTSGELVAKPPVSAETFSRDGLQKVSIKGLELAYALSGATLAGYSRVLLDPVQVAFRKDWDPTPVQAAA